MPARVVLRLPSGTQLVIRTLDEINVASVDQTRDYDGQIDREVVGSDGRVLIPARSPVKLSVFSSGDNNLELGVRSIAINGRNYQVNSNTEKRTQREGIGKNKRTATMVGGGALLGTLIGAVAGGGKGAAIGAAVSRQRSSDEETTAANGTARSRSASRVA